MNWDIVFEVLLGAVLGFISSVAVGVLTKRVAAYRLLEKMRQELVSNYSVISENLDSPKRFQLVSPIWDYMFNSEIIFSFSAQKYATIVRIYGEIQSFKESENSISCTQYELEKNRKRFLEVVSDSDL